jgi:hypothetical protein
MFKRPETCRKAGMLSLVLLVAALGGMSSTLSAQPTADQTSFSNAYKSYAGKDYWRALNYINQAISVNTTNGNYFLMRGNIYFLMGKKGDAEKDYRRSLQINPRNTELKKFYDNTFNNYSGKSVENKKNLFYVSGGGAYEYNSLRQSIYGYQYGLEYVSGNLLMSVNVMKTILNDEYWYSMLHANYGIGLHVSLVKGVLFFQLVGGIGLSGYLFMQNTQGLDVFLQTGFKVAFVPSFGMSVTADLIYSNLSQEAVINAWFSNSVKLDVVSVNIHIGFFYKTPALF